MYVCMYVYIYTVVRNDIMSSNMENFATSPPESYSPPARANNAT